MPDDITNFPEQGDDKEINLRNSNFPQFDYNFALDIKGSYPDIWKEGGNIRGNEAFEYWGKARKPDKSEGVLEWIKEREAWMSRHEKDKLIAGVVAVMKWGGIVTRGEKYMKDLINDEKEGDKMSKIKKVMACEIKQVGEESDRILRFIGSDETPDRDRDIIEVAGWKCEEYMTNPVFLWAHDYSMPPVGKAVGVTKDLTSKRLVFDIKFPTLEELSSDIKNPSEHAKFVDTVYNLYKGGYMSATSVGFRGIKSKARDDDEMLDKPEWQRGRRYMEQSLMELSAVPVPSNPNALQQAKSAGIDTEIVEKAMELKEVKLLVDTNTKEVFVWENGQKTAKVAIDEEYYESIFEAKAGATLSKKSKEMLNKVCDEMTESGNKLRKFIDGAGMMEEEPMMTADMTMSMTDPMMEPMMSAMRTAIADELKQALDEMKSQVSLLLQKDAPKVIDLDAIEFPKAKENPDQIQLNIEPEELKRLIREATQNLIQGGN